MTKRNLLLVGLFLVFGLGTMATNALAQAQWVPGYSTGGFGRAEGYAEETGVYTFTYYGTQNVAATNYFTVTYNAPLVPGSAFLQCTGNLATGTNAASPFSNGLCNGDFTVTQLGQVVTITFAKPVVFAGQVYSILSLTVRVNATAVKCGTDVTGTGAAFQVVPPAPSLTTSGVALPVLLVNCEPTLSLGFATEGSDQGWNQESAGAAYVLSCIGTKRLGEYDKDFTINVDEEFANALTSASYEYASDPDATGATNFTVLLTNIPSGVTVSPDTPVACGPVTSPPSCAGGGLLTVQLEGSGGPTPLTGTPAVYTQGWTFTVMTEDSGVPESVNIRFKFWSHGPLPAGLPQMVANVYKGPVDLLDSKGNVIYKFIPGFSGALEGSGGVPWNLSVVEFTDCLTTLLYPYVTNGLGWDTGLEVSNTTLDPFNVPSAMDSPPGPNPLDLMPYYGKGSAVPQAGPCTFYLFANGNIPWTAWYTTPTINPGATYAFGVASTPGFGAKGAGVSAYSIAVCDFQNAHGDAFITYNLFGTNGVAANYLADVLPSPQWYHRTPGGDMLGETAIAPYMINRRILRLLHSGGCCF